MSGFSGRGVLGLCALFAAGLLLYATSLQGYLLFHSVAEMTAVAVSFSVFIVTWNARFYIRSGCLEFIGIGHLAVAALDLLHTLAYPGMNVFASGGTNLPAQLWVAARAVQAASLAAAPLFAGSSIRHGLVLTGYALVATGLAGAVFSDRFPACFLEGQGLTAFKVNAEYAIIAALAVAAVGLYRVRARFRGEVLGLFLGSILATMAAEFMFTRYASAYAPANMAGHYLKLVAVFLLYRAILVTGIQQPFQLIFRELAQTGEDLERSQAELEERVRERTRELAGANARLEAEITVRRAAEKDLARHHAHLESLVANRTTDLDERNRELERSREALAFLVEDLNEHRAQLEEANEKLKELDRLKSMFIASMSHELRTPLNSIIGFTGIILQGMSGPLSDRQKDQLQRVFGAARHLLALITDVIDISKIEAGRIEVYPEPLMLHEVVGEAAASLQSQFRDKGLVLDLQIPETIAMVTDRKRLLQCILNYMSNAIKYSRAGTVTVAAREEDGWVSVTVRDTGIGIAPSDLPRLFGAFNRLDSPLKVANPGTGLGLYLTRKIATELLQGEVDVESTLGEGSTFSLAVARDLVAGEAKETS